MKNYLSKIENINIKDYVFKFKKNNPFGTIISLIAIIFLLSLYFTIPTFYNYENFEKEIQRKVSKDFKLNIKNISVFKLHHFIERSRFLCFCLSSFDKIEP